MHPVRRVCGALAVVFATLATGAVAAPVSIARAGLVNLGACNDATLSQPFAPWGDPSSYELAPGGDFETSGWTLTGGAQLVSGSEPYAATGTLGDSSLSLPAGSSAVSPSTCVDAAYPTIRFFVGGTGIVAVSVDDGGLDIPAGVATAGGSWQPTPIMLTDSALLAALSGGTAQVSLQLTALSGDPQVDDVFIDPWNRG
ncbi:MAG TPA: hypothetical protein VHX62_16780 [Solirubrobacteraceae bacterium]|jgi:hypothetical protein|nr:hypothetical protein [Solirubrobacteraceae bacterium]